MSAYPYVMSERDTLDLVRSGMSLARYGDGEFNLCRGYGIPTQPHDRVLAASLRSILKDGGMFLVGIPNIKSPTPKADFWQPYQRANDLLSIERRYASAFVTRPDSAPWIDAPDYWQAVESLWVGLDVTLVRGSARSLTAADLVGANSVTEIIAPAVNAWASYDSLLEQIGTPKRALLCLGPTATVLAVDLYNRGVHAIDLGHVGLFLRKHRAGDPMVRTEADKVLA